jgi:hypothetical protein
MSNTRISGTGRAHTIAQPLDELFQGARAEVDLLVKSWPWDRRSRELHFGSFLLECMADLVRYLNALSDLKEILENKMEENVMRIG